MQSYGGMPEEKIEKFLEKICPHFEHFRVLLTLSERVDLLGQRINLRELDLRVLFTQLFQQLHHLTQMNFSQLP